jgi:hypothetical protein
MIRQLGSATTIVFVLTSVGGQGARAQGPDPPAQHTADSTADSQESERRDVLESDRWRRAYRNFNEWLSVQQIYTAEEVATLRAELPARIAKMTPRELEEFLKDMEVRLAVLTSPEAEEARQWLAQFVAVVRDPEARLGRSRPDVLNMTAGEIRAELQWLQQHRAGTRQTRAAFEQVRTQQASLAEESRAATRQLQQQSREIRSRAAANWQYRSAYSPRRDDEPRRQVRFESPRPFYRISPWGTPMRWDPFNNP